MIVRTLMAALVVAILAATPVAAGQQQVVYVSSTVEDLFPVEGYVHLASEVFPAELKLGGILPPTPAREPVPDDPMSECDTVAPVPGVVVVFLNLLEDQPFPWGGWGARIGTNGMSCAVIWGTSPQKMAEAIAGGVAGALGTPFPPGAPTMPPFSGQQVSHISAAVGNNPAPAEIPLPLLGRFLVTVEFAAPGQPMRSAEVIPLTSRGGIFWFFNRDNPEMLMKMQNACVPPFNRHWVFFAATTNVQFVVAVTDTVTGTTREYHNPQGQLALPMADTDFFDTCF